MFSNWILDYLQIKQGSRQNKRTTEHLNTARRNPALNGKVKRKNIKTLQAKRQSIAELLQSVSEGSNRLTCGFFSLAWVFVAKILTFRYKQHTHRKKKKKHKDLSEGPIYVLRFRHLNFWSHTMNAKIWKPILSQHCCQNLTSNWNDLCPLWKWWVLSWSTLIPTKNIFHQVRVTFSDPDSSWATKKHLLLSTPPTFHWKGSL